MSNLDQGTQGVGGVVGRQHHVSMLLGETEIKELKDPGSESRFVVSRKWSGSRRRDTYLMMG